MTWLQQLIRFHEVSPNQGRENITIDGNTLTSLVNRNVFTCGQSETLSLTKLRKNAHSFARPDERISAHKLEFNFIWLPFLCIPTN